MTSNRRQSKLIDIDRVPGRVRYAHEYESVSNDIITYYQGHPRICTQTENHPPHEYRYSFRLRDGSIVNGSRRCTGEGSVDCPKRWIDMTPEEQLEFERQRDVLRKKNA